jgi:hypothetical protein
MSANYRSSTTFEKRTEFFASNWADAEYGSTTTSAVD